MLALACAAGFAAATGSTGAAAAGAAFASSSFCADTKSSLKSSPGFPIMARIPSTGMAFPSSTPRYNSVPAWYDSNSMVALSVSTSATSSPFLTVSPTFLCHFTNTPSVMVSDILGILTISAIFF